MRRNSLKFFLRTLIFSSLLLLILFIAYFVYALTHEEKMARETCIRNQKKATQEAAKQSNTVGLQVAFTRTDFGESYDLMKKNYSKAVPLIETYKLNIPIEDEVKRIQRCKSWPFASDNREIRKVGKDFYLLNIQGVYKLENRAWQRILGPNDMPVELRQDQFYITGTDFPFITDIRGSSNGKLAFIMHLGNKPILALLKEGKSNFYDWEFSVSGVVFDPQNSNILYIIANRAKEIYKVDLRKETAVTQRLLSAEELTPPAYFSNLNIAGNSIYVLAEAAYQPKPGGNKLIKINKVTGEWKVLNKEVDFPGDYRPEFYSVNTTNPNEVIIGDSDDNIYLTENDGFIWTNINHERFDPDWHTLVFNLQERRVVINSRFKELKINKKLGNFRAISVD